MEELLQHIRRNYGSQAESYAAWRRQEAVKKKDRAAISYWQEVMQLLSAGKR